MAMRKLYSTRKVVFNTLRGGVQFSSVRNVSVTASRFKEAKAAKEEFRPEWERAMAEAEKAVGHSTSFLSLRYLMNDEFVNWGEHMEKLEGSDHPMFYAAKVLLQQGHHNINRTWGLVVLLMSKVAGYPEGTPENDIDEASGLLKTHITLAEAVETSCSAHDIHRNGILNMQHFIKGGIEVPSDSDLIFGNKIAILGGDILFGFAGIQMGKLKHHVANMLIATAARDVADSHFIGERDIQNNPLPSDPKRKIEEQMKNPELFNKIPTDQIDNKLMFDHHDIFGSAENEWKLRHTLKTGTMLGKACQCAMLLANHNEELQKEAYFFGKHLYLGWQASKDLEPFMNKDLPPGGKFSLVSAPILYHLEHDHSLYELIRPGLDTIENVDYAKIHEIVRNGPGMEKTRELLNKNNLIATTLLYKFPQSESRRALESIILALEF